MKRNRSLFGVLCLGLSYATSSVAQLPIPDNISGPVALQPSFVGDSAPLTELAASFAAGELSAATDAQAAADGREVVNMLIRPPNVLEERSASIQSSRDPVLQAAMTGGWTPPPILSFEGTSDDDNAEVLGGRVVPPDTEGDVGRRYFVQSNNLLFEIFDKRNGNSVLGPLPNSIFFSGTGSTCDVNNDGDPIVLFDHQRRRWIFSQFALFEFADDGIFGIQCFAVSKSANPLGGYWLYEYRISGPNEGIPGSNAGFNDYPKVTVWPNGLYMSTNNFEQVPDQGFFFSGVAATAFDKNAMYRGRNAVGVRFLILAGATGLDEPFAFSLQPSHWEGSNLPIGGSRAPNVFFQVFDEETWGEGLAPDGPDGYRHWSFRPNFRRPERSTFVDLGLIGSPNFDSLICFEPFFGECAPQPDTDQLLDTLSQFSMYRAQYRAFDDYDSVVISSSVNVDRTGGVPPGNGGVRWAELRKNRGGDFQVHQAGTYAPDGDFRWLPTIAQDKAGNIAVGYSVSSKSTFPSIRYATRAPDEAPGTLGDEQSCQEGTGSQIPAIDDDGEPFAGERWGDYATLSVDPVDECTFWLTSEYYEETADFDFKTRICSFKMAHCGD